MAKKGESKAMKRLNAPRVVSIHRKKHTFIIRPIAGPHSKNRCVALGVVVRDLLGLATTAAEVKKVVKKGSIKVDGKTCKDYKRAIGFMDVISIPSTDTYYRLIYDRKGRLHPQKIDRRQSVFKLSKVEDKKRIKAGKLQLNLYDGKNILSERKVNTGDVLQLELPTLKITSVLPLKKGSYAYVTGGKHAGESGSIVEMSKGTARRTAITTIKTKNGEIKTPTSNVFVLGEEKPLVDISE